jgi:hypothetical protein
MLGDRLTASSELISVYYPRRRSYEKNLEVGCTEISVSFWTLQRALHFRITSTHYKCVNGTDSVCSGRSGSLRSLHKMLSLYSNGEYRKIILYCRVCYVIIRLQELEESSFGSWLPCANFGSSDWERNLPLCSLELRESFCTLQSSSQARLDCLSMTMKLLRFFDTWVTWLFTGRRGVTTQKTWIFNSTAVKTSNLASLKSP